MIQEFLKTGYCPTFDAIRVKFPYADETRELRDWTTGVVDGQTRVLACFAIVGFCAELELDDLQMMEIQDVLSSLKLLRCSYKHFDHPGHHFLHSLSVSVCYED